MGGLISLKGTITKFQPFMLDCQGSGGPDGPPCPCLHLPLAPLSPSALAMGLPHPPRTSCQPPGAISPCPSKASATAGMVSSCPQTCPAGPWGNANCKQECCHLYQAAGIDKVSHHQQVKHLKTNENKSMKCCKSVHSECLCACVSIYLLHLHGRGEEEVVHTRVMQTVYFFF